MAASRTTAPGPVLAKTKNHGSPGLGQVPAGLAASVSGAPSRAKILGCDGWGPRAPPRVPSRFPGPRVGLGSSLQPSLPRVASQAGPPGQAYGRQAALLWPGTRLGRAGAKASGASLVQPHPEGPAGRAGRRHLPPSGCLPAPLLPPRTLLGGLKPLPSYSARPSLVHADSRR